MRRFLQVLLTLALCAFAVVVVRFTAPRWSESVLDKFRDRPAPVEITPEDQTELEERIRAATPQDEQALLERAEQFFAHGAISFAEKDLALLLEKNPQSRDAYLLLTKLHIRTRNFAAAEATANRGLEAFPNNPDLLLLRGDVYVQQGKFSEARTNFSALPPNSPERDFFLGVIAIIEGQYELAEDLLTKAQASSVTGKRSEILLTAFREFALFPDGSPLHRDTLLAKALNDVEMYELSLQLTKKVLEQNGGYRDAWLTNGYSYLALERFEFARLSFQKAFEIDPANPAISFYLGYTLKRLGDLNSAINFFERARQNGFKPEGEVLRELGDTYYLQENYQLAFKTFEAMLQKEVGSVAEFVRPMYIVLTFLKQSETGIALGNNAVQKYPEEAMAWNLRGWAYLETGDLAKAEQDLTKALNLDANLSAAHLNLGFLRERQKRFDEALDQYEKVYQLDPLSDIGRTAVERYNSLVE